MTAKRAAGVLLMASAALAVVGPGCSGNPEVVPRIDGIPDQDGGGGDGGRGNGTGGVVFDPDGGGGGGAGGTGGGVQPCGTTSCGIGQRCEENDAGPVCVDLECSDLICDDELEECTPAPGGGNYCRSIACTRDVDCPESRHCDGTKCVDDVCEPGVQRCDGDQVFICAPNGGADEPAFTCGSPAYFSSECQEGTGSAGCTCEDDWDCPEYTDCEQASCLGTGVEPTCKLPPVPFSQVLPQLEFHWGGTEYAGDTGSDPSEDDAIGSPFPWSAQASSTPVVANLDDDNGDGLVNESDFPEILFITYHGDNPDSNGVVRAIHGGGPNKGKDFFALCGNMHWLEGDPLPTTGQCRTVAQANDANARSGGTLAVGDLDYDGFPEVVVGLEDGRVRILSSTGAIVATTTDIRPSGARWNYPGPAIVNLDHAGLAEIVVGNRVITLRIQNDAIAIDRVFGGTFRTGAQYHDNEALHHGPMVCPADISADHPGIEVVAGTSAYRLPDVPPNCNGANASTDYCQNVLTLVWDAQAENPGEIPDDQADGFCAVADVLGADTGQPPGPGNPLDRVPEVLVIADGHLLILEASTGNLLEMRELETDTSPRRQGGAPNVDDFDGDGFPEIGTSMPYNYQVIDLQAPSANCPAWNSVLDKSGPPPQGNPARDPGGACTSDGDCNAGAVCNRIAGACTCLHSGWRRATEDDSSRVTSSSVFDFNGDGAAEVVYNDECYFRIYDGATANVYLQLPSMSRTLVENPVVADVDNDGNAEIVFSQNNDQVPDRCSEALLDSWPNGDNDVVREKLGNGIDVWGDPTDVWVAARRIWNQNAYHVTNVTESVSVPMHEPESWRPYNGRLYNTYRSQPRQYGVAPDLALTAIQVSSPDVACGTLSDTIRITVEVENLGDLRAGAGVPVEVFGTWDGSEEPLNDATGMPLTLLLSNSLDPRGSILVSFEYQPSNNGMTRLSDSVRVIVDGGDHAAGCDACGAERECREDNNEIDTEITAGAALADLRVAVDSASGCSAPRVTLTVVNDGATEASDVLVRIFAGDPNAGGTLLGETTVPGPLGQGESATVTVTLGALSRNVTLYAVVDPLDAIEECDNGNNLAQGPRLNCAIQ